MARKTLTKAGKKSTYRFVPLLRDVFEQRGIERQIVELRKRSEELARRGN